MGRLIDMTGQRFGRFVVLAKHPDLLGKQVAWECVCDCGNRRVVTGSSLRTGNSRSCGCYQKEQIASDSRTHGMSRTPEFNAWCKMRRRCSNPSDATYDYYGGRGIRVCDRWDSFDAFLEDMGLRPSPNHSIDRINNDGDYEPGNCRWATRHQQARNKRSNHRITMNGKTQTLREWADETGIKRATIAVRLKAGWTAEKALTTPPQVQRIST